MDEAKGELTLTGLTRDEELDHISDDAARSSLRIECGTLATALI